MKEILTTITQRGQVTVPAEVRRLLGAKSGDELAFRIEGDEVHLVPVEFTLETAYGSVTPLHRPEDFDAMIAEAMEEQAGESARKLRDRP